MSVEPKNDPPKIEEGLPKTDRGRSASSETWGGRKIEHLTSISDGISDGLGEEPSGSTTSLNDVFTQNTARLQRSTTLSGTSKTLSKSKDSAPPQATVIQPPKKTQSDQPDFPRSHSAGKTRELVRSGTFFGKSTSTEASKSKVPQKLGRVQSFLHPDKAANSKLQQVISDDGFKRDVKMFVTIIEDKSMQLTDKDLQAIKKAGKKTLNGETTDWNKMPLSQLIQKCMKIDFMRDLLLKFSKAHQIHESLEFLIAYQDYKHSEGKNRVRLFHELVKKYVQEVQENIEINIDYTLRKNIVAKFERINKLATEAETSDSKVTGIDLMFEEETQRFKSFEKKLHDMQKRMSDPDHHLDTREIKLKPEVDFFIISPQGIEIFDQAEGDIMTLYRNALGDQHAERPLRALLTALSEK